jgi:hypothetical protein
LTTTSFVESDSSTSLECDDVSQWGTYDEHHFERSAPHKPNWGTYDEHHFERSAPHKPNWGTYDEHHFERSAPHKPNWGTYDEHHFERSAPHKPNRKALPDEIAQVKKERDDAKQELEHEQNRIVKLERECMTWYICL